MSRSFGPGLTPSVLMLFGGPGPENVISCQSARSALKALESSQRSTTAVYIGRQGDWHLAPTILPENGYALEAWAGFADEMIRCPDVALRGSELRAVRDDELLAIVDVVFPLVHGSYGEDGTVQSILDHHQVPYVGSGAAACERCIDKVQAKRIVGEAGIPVVDHLVVGSGAMSPADIEFIGLPAFVKPARGGSSFGITRLTDWTDLGRAVTLANRYDTKVMVERAVVGRELSIGVLDNGPLRGPEVSEPLEAVFEGHSWYDYSAKYLDNTCGMLSPADLPPDTLRTMQLFAATAFSSLGCRGLARVDFFVDAGQAIYFNEINTMPGLSSMSLFPAMWARSGLGYDDLLERLVSDARRMG